jgi:hypothetical protein
MKRLLLFLLFLLLPVWVWGGTYSLYISQDETAAYPAAKGAVAAIGYNGKIMATDATGNAYLYNSGGWSVVSDGGGSARPRSMFIDHAGAMFISWVTGIWKSTDDGANWTSVLTFPQATGVATAITEDEAGNLYAGQYQTTVDNDARLYKSTDGGDNWTDITPVTGDWQAGSYRHVHYVYYCPHRLTLYVALGDVGSNSIYYSTDKGTTFTKWTGSVQTVVIVSDANYVYGSGDAGANRDIWRATTATITGNQAATSVFTEASAVAVWTAHVDSYGNIIFIYSTDGDNAAKIVASTDGGATFSNIKTLTTSAHGIFAKPSSYYFSGDGWIYGGSIVNTFMKLRLLPSTGQILVNATSGTDYTNSGVTTAWKTIEAANIGMKGLTTGQGIRLQTDASDKPLLVSGSGLIINGDRHILSGGVTTAPDFSDSFEGSDPFTTKTTTNGTIATDSTDVFHAGAKSMKVQATAANSAVYGNKNVVSVAAGGTFWAQGWVYISSVQDVTATDYFDLMVIRDSGATANINVRMVNTKTPFIRTSWSPATNYYQGNLNSKAISLDTWTKIKVAVYSHATQGSITLWIGNDIALKVVGINTAVVNWYGARFGMGTSQYHAGSPETLYWDDIAAGDTDPDQPKAIEVTGNNNTLRYFTRTQDMDITGTGNTLRYLIGGFGMGIIYGF